MTLILGMATAPFALHVGDRLLSKGSDPWDPLANKSVLIVGSDGWACVSYSGLAYIDGKPTDEWLAEAFGGVAAAPPVRPGAGPGTRFSGFVPQVGLGLVRMREAIETDFVRQPRTSRRLGIQILVTGFIFPRRRKPMPRGRPFMRRYSHGGRDHDAVEIVELPRYWEWDRGRIQIGGIGAGAAHGRSQALSALSSAQLRNEDDCERILVDAIRATSALNQYGVGSDSMSIVLGRYGGGRARSQ